MRVFDWIPLAVLAGVLAVEGAVAVLLFSPPLRAAGVKLAEALASGRGAVASKGLAAWFSLFTGIKLVEVFLGARVMGQLGKHGEVGGGQGTVAVQKELYASLLAAGGSVAALVLMLLLGLLAQALKKVAKLELNLKFLKKQAEAQQQHLLGSDLRAKRGDGDDAGSSGGSEHLRGLLQEARAARDKAEQDLADAQTDVKRAKATERAMRAQSMGLEKEYDRLLAEYGALEQKLKRFEAGGGGGSPSWGTKKDD